MKLEFQESQTPYVSGSQSARAWTEAWASENLYCPSCGTRPLQPFENNRPVADLHCGACNEQFELKSSKKPFANKVVDGAHATMIARLTSRSNPSLFLLSYDRSALRVSNLTVVPKHFFTPDIIEKRKPLGPRARRAGWTGCNILYGKVPRAGRIVIVENGAPRSAQSVVEQWKRNAFLQIRNDKARGWLLDVMRCVESIGKPEFGLDEVYAFAPDLQIRYPNNRHIREKIRQQLQVLRDNDWLEFTGRGQYRLSLSQ
ncbi:DpnI domain-containing protein [Maricaulis maris]|uniref:Type II restriction enzyme n=1 Tax=Maricaulis maris TaxID=74318 RepID=A0A495D4I7_9PROT|nr:DpnI domain-containing protein [Maricaulis maris]RKQ96826.1 type II restriction enzyme [Maricaulis maris]